MVRKLDYKLREVSRGYFISCKSIRNILLWTILIIGVVVGILSELLDMVPNGFIFIGVSILIVTIGSFYSIGKYSINLFGISGIGYLSKHKSGGYSLISDQLIEDVYCAPSLISYHEEQLEWIEFKISDYETKKPLKLQLLEQKKWVEERLQQLKQISKALEQ